MWTMSVVCQPLFWIMAAGSRRSRVLWEHVRDGWEMMKDLPQTFSGLKSEPWRVLGLVVSVRWCSHSAHTSVRN